MEIEAAARRECLADRTIAGYVQQRVYRDRLAERVDQTGQSAVVVRRNNGWAVPEPGRSQEYPILQVLCYADPSRDDEGQIVSDDAASRAWALARAVKGRFHGVREQWWGTIGSNPGLLVVTGNVHGEPFLVSDRDRHGDGQPLGDSVYVVVELDLQVVR